jgi:cysteinyl-tRNA synthetase
MAHRMPIAGWAYQLQDIEPKRIAALDVDLVVVDYSADGSDEEAFTTADVERMRQRPGGRPKKIVCYMSIGEAESYRYYWSKAWRRKERRPAWLDRENPDWHENYKVRYWDPDWQKLILGTPAAYLDRIVAAGYDGVYLDIVDAFEHYEKNRSTARAEMIAFVRRIADYARVQRPGFMVIPQNGESLLADASYRAVISAIAKEDLLYGLDDDGCTNDADEVRECLDHLSLARKDRIPVLVVEYLDSKRQIAAARDRLGSLGFAAYFGPRDLDEVRAFTT